MVTDGNVCLLQSPPSNWAQLSLSNSLTQEAARLVMELG